MQFTGRALSYRAEPLQVSSACRSRTQTKQVAPLEVLLPFVATVDAGFIFVPFWQVLCSWLSNSPNYEEITKWYLGWKSMFSDQVLAHPSVKDKFNEALDIMNRAVSSNVGE